MRRKRQVIKWILCLLIVISLILMLSENSTKSNLMWEFLEPYSSRSVKSVDSLVFFNIWHCSLSFGADPKNVLLLPTTCEHFPTFNPLKSIHPIDHIVLFIILLLNKSTAKICHTCSNLGHNLSQTKANANGAKLYDEKASHKQMWEWIEIIENYRNRKLWFRCSTY